VLREKGKQTLKKALYILISVYLMLGFALTVFQEKLLFLPTQLEQDFKFEFQYPFEELFLKPDRETIINALHFKAENPKGVILYFHGNADNLSRWGTIVTYFVKRNYDVLIPDYRTYGKSKGKLSEAVFYTDAQYCYDYLLEQYPEDHITLYGRSLGTGIASKIAADNTPKQLILETPYYSIADVANHRIPMFPVSRLLKYKFPTYKYLSKVNCPITIFHGTEDRVVPYSSGDKLRTTNKTIDFITIKGGKHNNLVTFKTYQDHIARKLP